ncbi:hypothetical protein GOP47_0017614 [Adiantum capillus-veneris]|uniref:Uncharacterized protein n=1 Tax=Adiantum capillus-veneris TaxID=13818 RepID=A0A9D4UFP6_ADICA|nr:hypothetical protein GOP47_0017614 [Adiantum capillus-veneris]
MAAPLVKCRQHAAILQLTPTSTAVYSFITSNIQILSSTLPILGIDVWDSHALLWSETSAELFHIGQPGHRLVASLPSFGCSYYALHQNYIFRVQGLTIEVLDFQGTLRHKLELSEPQGRAISLDVCLDFFLVATENSFIQMWKLEDEFDNSWLPGFGRKVPFVKEGACNIDTLMCNYNGTKVSFLAKIEGDSVESVLYIYDANFDKFSQHDFRLEGKLLVSLVWDSEEFHQLACGLTPLETHETNTITEIVTYFVDSDLRLIKQDKVEISSQKTGLIAKREPYVFLYEGLCNDESSSPVIKKMPMGILTGMEKLDGKVRQDVVNFSYYVLMGHDVDAFKVLESIKDERILKKIVRYCMKHHLHKFATQCFVNMGRAYAVSAIDTMKDQLSDQNKGTTAAAMAIQLGCVADAEQEYIECKRFDLLIDLYQTCGFWEKSIEIALKYDHVNLKNVHHAYAKHLEAVGDMQMAIHQYELSNTHRYEVPRMLYSLGKVDDLKKYVVDKKDPSLHRWWANYCEAKGMLHNAIDHYKLAGEVASVVRVQCLLGDLETAENIVTETSDPSATFHLGQQHEKLGNIARAMQLFAKAGRTDCAANLAMKHEIDKELLSLALQGTKKTMLSSAKYFEEKGCCEEAVLLYQKGGDIEKAVDVCVHFQLFDALRAIADNLNEGTDPSILVRCGDFLLSHKHYDKATLLLIAAGQHRRAFELCIHEGVEITDKMMELFSKQIFEENPEDSKQLLVALAEFCDSQGSFHLACRTYTQAGDKVNAMKALMKSGDTEKVLIYANVSRQKQLYVLAAGYLQTLNWHHDANIMKRIVQMYTKAGEMELLGSFYEACAQVEIDGFRDYEKALSAMKEAWKFFSKVQSPRRNGKMQSLKIRIEEVESFVQARRLAKSDPNGMISACTTLLTELSLQDRNGQAALRVGDLYALLIEYYHKEGNMSLAYETLQTMGSCKLPLSAFVDQNIINSVYEANGVQAVE